MTEPETATAPTLDQAVGRALDALGAHNPPAPDALFLLGTGTGVLPTRLQSAGGVPLVQVDGVPLVWRDHFLHWGRFGELTVWMLEDTTDEPAEQAAVREAPPWAVAFPCWLAAEAGASSLMITAAGSALEAEGREALAAGQIAFVSDHLNLSGTTPLFGLADSRLGPMFPDLTALHDERLRACARAMATEIGLDAREAVAACTAGPSLDTPAERRFYARAGADIAVQGLADPLLAAAHAGLGVLAVIVVTDAEEGAVDLTRILSIVQRTAPALEDLIVKIAEGMPRALKRGRDAFEDTQ